MITAAITGVFFLVVSLRVYVRAVMLKNVDSDDYTVSKVVLVEQNSTSFVCQMMIAMVDPISVIFANRLLTFTAFCSWGVRLFYGGSQARNGTPFGCCSCSKYSEGYGYKQSSILWPNFSSRSQWDCSDLDLFKEMVTRYKHPYGCCTHKC